MAALLRTPISYAVFGFLTLLAFIGLNTISASATADEVVQKITDFLSPNTFDIDNILRVDNDVYSVTYDDTVSTEVLGTQTVRKIGYGNSEIVTITSTPSGTYSSDAMFSPHFKYPGVEVKHVGTVKAWVLFGDNQLAAVALADADSFTNVKSSSADSFIILAQ